MSITTHTLHQTVVPESVVVPRVCLRFSLEDADPTEQMVDQRLFYVGSSPECDVVVDDGTVSRTHARIEVHGNGHRIRDLQSKNGTWVNGVRVEDAHVPAQATLRFGGVEVEFVIQPETVEVSLSPRGRFGELIGESLEMREIFALLDRVAPTDTTLLVEGPSGTGKELVARAIHDHSPRREGPFVVFDCSAIHANLLESELFGHVKGAFTGADSDRVGALEQAHGGTLFVDEIGELRPDLQPKLLRVLDTRELKPLGSNRRVQIDARIVAATNRRLVHDVKTGLFREDLYYRLAVIAISLPPLRNRPEDIPALVEHFLRQLGGEERNLNVSYETMAKLQAHDWPGNVRELRNFVERAVVLSQGDRIETRFLGGPNEVGLTHRSPREHGGETNADIQLPFKQAKSELLDAFETDYWTQQLAKSGGNISEAARRGGIHRKSLEYLLKKHDIDARTAGENEG